eukprot:COSAG02_NODE_42854_length_380_cov_1.099644_1_plen_91_part_00
MKAAARFGKLLDEEELPAEGLFPQPDRGSLAGPAQVQLLDQAGGGWSFGELSFGLSAQVVPNSSILTREKASFGNQSILTRRNDKVSHLL